MKIIICWIFGHRPVKRNNFIPWRGDGTRIECARCDKELWVVLPKTKWVTGGY